VIVATVHCTGWREESLFDFIYGCDSCTCRGWREGSGDSVGGFDYGHCSMYRLE
jgi:hypothetical protein